MSALRPGILITAIVLAALGTAAQAEWVADSSDKRQVAAAEAIERIIERYPVSQQFFDDAHGFAIYPSVTRIGFGFGGALGRGIVVEGDKVIGRTSFRQFTSGIQAGARNFSMVVLFRDKEALEYFKKAELQFLGQAGLAAATAGAAGTPAYNEGVAIFTVTRVGLMGEFTVSGARFTYKPLDGVHE